MTDKEFLVLTSLIEDWRDEASQLDQELQYKASDILYGVSDQLENIIGQLRRKG